jgi:N-acetylmuramic acid 6-phosphate etherase
MDTIQRKDLSTEKQNVESLNIDELSIIRILELINNEDASIPKKIAASLAEIEHTVDLCIQSLKSNGRIFYIGAGTSGRLGVLDASEIPPTFSAPNDLFTGIIAGGDKALKNSIEGAEDDPEQAIKDLKNHNIKKEDVLIGISSSGAARYVQSALDYAKSIKAKIVYITCNKKPYLNVDADVAIALETGPEIITGSTRMKAGTATKMVLNMISSATMIKLGKVYGNLMVDLMAVNDKLVDRGCRIISQLTNVDEIVAKRTLVRSKMSVKTAIVMIYHSVGYDKAKKMIDDSDGILRKIIS